jgi:hypothetical protein
MVVSDGADSCGTDCANPPVDADDPKDDTEPEDMEQITSDLLSLGIKTFAVGFGSNVAGSGVSQEQLNAIAENGGTPFTEYFQAEDPEDLENAFDQIAAAVIPCTFEIDDPDPSADPDKVNFYFDGEVVGYDEDCANGEGWTWVDAEHTEVEFCDAACTQLRTTGVDLVSATFGCPTIIID